MLKANYLLKNQSGRHQSLTIEETGWRCEIDRAERKQSERSHRKKSVKEMQAHLRDTRKLLTMYHDAVALALRKVPSLMNEEAATLKRLEVLEARDATRKASKESNAKAQVKRDRAVAKNSRRVLENRERDLENSGTDGSGSGSDSESDSDALSEEEKAPAPVAPRRRKRSDDQQPARRQRSPREPVTANVQAQDEPRVPYPAGLTSVEIARLDAWVKPSFREFCYMDKYGLPAMQMIKAKSMPVPFVPAPAWYRGPEVEEHKDASPAVTPQAAPQHANPEAERALCHAMRQNGIEDLRVRLPIPAQREPRAAEMEMEVPLRDGSDSDVLTPAMDSMRVGD